ncbi:hypothetical protein MLD38_012727 [Melastoma candidum]|uniref:Uncharacterized protein n=1 Tax=Melastoma candidum TaxID=119954 RepID=A0ACB9R7J9_9MYRT|nr:hypothetical protein MLD38_012727 [Melastoma candidum]
MPSHPTSEVALDEEPRGESALSDPTPEEDAEGSKNSFPPGFSSVPLGPNVGESNGEDEDDDMPISQLRSRIRKHRAGRSCTSGGNLSESNKGLAASRNPFRGDVATTFEVALDEGQKAKSMPTHSTSEVELDEEPRGESALSDRTLEEERTFKNIDTPTMDPIPQQEIPGRTAWRSWSNFEVDVLELEISAQINELERNVAAIKASRQIRLPMDGYSGKETKS